MKNYWINLISNKELNIGERIVINYTGDLGTVLEKEIDEKVLFYRVRLDNYSDEIFTFKTSQITSLNEIGN